MNAKIFALWFVSLSHMVDVGEEENLHTRVKRLFPEMWASTYTIWEEFCNKINDFCWELKSRLTAQCAHGSESQQWTLFSVR